MNKIKIYEIAKKLNLSSKEVLEIAEKLNIEAKSHLSSIDEENVKKIEKLAKNDKTKGVKKEKVSKKEEKQPVIIRREVIIDNEAAKTQEKVQKRNERRINFIWHTKRKNICGRNTN